MVFKGNQQYSLAFVLFIYMLHIYIYVYWGVPVNKTHHFSATLLALRRPRNQALIVHTLG